MKPEEVNAMTDEELQVWAAKLTGATQFDSALPENVETGYWPEEDEGRGEGWKPVPCYPSDPAAAKVLVGILLANDYEVEIYMTKTEAQVQLWTLLRNTLVLQQWKDGDSTEQAITRAFIIQMSKKENHE